MDNVLKRDLARDYALTLSWRFAEVDFLGLPNLKEERTFRLESIYVPLRLCREPGGRFDRQGTIYLPQALREERHLIVLGDPGSGKSTLVKALTYAFGEANNNPYKRACGELIPIPIILRNYTTRKWHTAIDMIADFAGTVPEELRSEITPGWLMGYLRDGKAIVLIDGLDEVGGPEERVRLRNEVIFPLLLEARGSCAVLTSRIVGYDEVPFDSIYIDKDAEASPAQRATPRTSRFYLLPFDDDQIANFVTRWYRMRQLLPERQEVAVQELLQALNENDRVKRLAHNPQLLTLITLVHRVRASLPSGRVELYNKIVEAYLETIDLYRGLGTPAKLDEMKRWLARIGWEMQSRRDSEEEVWALRYQREESPLASREEIKEWLVSAIAVERAPSQAEALAETFLEYVVKRSGLLVPSGPGRFAFAHLTFQEYFAAFHLRSSVRRFERLARQFTELVSKREWHETLNLLFEMLTEFPGAGDDLITEISTNASGTPTVRAGASEFVAKLLKDEQSGLTRATQNRAAEFTLRAVSKVYNESVIVNLKDLPPDSLDQFIVPWFIRCLRELHPREFGRFFITNGAELVYDWPGQLTQWIAGPTFPQLTSVQIAEIMLVSARDGAAYQKVCDWAIERLSIRKWLQRLCHSFGDGFGLTLAELYRTALISNPDRTARGDLLLEFSLALAITKTLTFRFALALVARDLPYTLSPSAPVLQSKLYIPGLRSADLNRAHWIAMDRALKRAPARDLARDIAYDLCRDASSWAQDRLLSALTREPLASEKMFIKPAINSERLYLLAEAERAMFEPHLLDGVLVSDLNNLMSASDDWSRLLASSALLALGQGRPELCRYRNELLTKGMRLRERFTFPSPLSSETRVNWFMLQLPRLMELAFLQGPDHAWLDPGLFKESSPESRYFRSSAGELLTLSTKILNATNESTETKLRSR
jgi:internalin A